MTDAAGAMAPITGANARFDMGNALTDPNVAKAELIKNPIRIQ